MAVTALDNFLDKTTKPDSCSRAKLLILLEPPVGFEPTTFRLRIECSTN